MPNWNFEKGNIKLYKELLNIDSTIEYLFSQLYTNINDYDPQILKFWDDSGLKPKVDTYLLRYVVPFYDLSKNPENAISIESIIIQLLSCITWRTFDNCVDGHVPIEKGHKTSLIAAMHLIGYTQKVSKKNILPILEHHFKLMNEQSIFEKKSPVKLKNIWKRCSIFLFAAEEISLLHKGKTEIYKQYINYTGLAHDVHDFFSDLKENIISLPVFWMNQINPDSVFSINRVQLLYQRVRVEVEPIEIMFDEINVAENFPLLNHFLKESRETFHSE